MRSYIFDWDDNILHMPTKIKMDKKEGSNWVPVDVSTEEFALVRTNPDYRSFYKLDVNGKQRVQSVLELDDVLTLNAISTPSDPATNKSSIYMDSADGSIKVKINVEGTVVTRTIASFE